VEVCLALKVQKLHLDFKIGAHETVKEVFPNAIIGTCGFHVAQVWWTKGRNTNNFGFPILYFLL